MTNRIRVYVGSLVLLAAGTFGMGLSTLVPTLSRDAAQGAVWFAVLSRRQRVCSHIRRLRAERRDRSHFCQCWRRSSLPRPGSRCSCRRAQRSLLRSLQRRVLIKAIFNVAQAMFWVASAILAYRYLGGEPLLPNRFRVNYPAFVAALARFCVSALGALAGAISISEGKSFFEVWWSGARVTSSYDLLTLPFVYVCACCYVVLGSGWCDCIHDSGPRVSRD